MADRLNGAVGSVLCIREYCLCLGDLQGCLEQKPGGNALTMDH